MGDTASLACVCFCCATQGFMFVRTRAWECVMLLLAMVCLFRPDIPQDFIYPPYRNLAPDKVDEVIALLEPERSHTAGSEHGAV
ncbi:MAG: DUF3394 domain-containing protein [Desulfovibrio sp.]|nr:DUF3394 domain-containing protein [Desulfovibrio sp.]